VTTSSSTSTSVPPPTTAPSLVERTSPGGYRVELPSDWKFQNAGSVGDHFTELWYDPTDPLRKLQVVGSGCAGCVEDQQGNPDASQAVPAGSSSFVISPTKVGYLVYEPDNPNPDNGLIVVVTVGQTSNGYFEVDLFLPQSQHSIATSILNGFTVDGPSSSSTAVCATIPSPGCD
jgi:hypothetical protein